MDPACLELIHHSPGRWRYRVLTATPIDWSALERDLAGGGLDPSRWQWRCNRLGRSIVLNSTRELDRLHRDGEAVASARQALLAALLRCGATPPPPPVIQVRVRPMHEPIRRPTPWLLQPLNLTSLLLSTALLLLALATALLAAPSLLLPLWPAGPLLMLSLLLVELAFQLRRPFVMASA